jgi:hypothetical protein
VSLRDPSLNFASRHLWRLFFALRGGVAKSLFALLALTPLNLAFDGLSQHMRAILEPLQHVIGARDSMFCDGQNVVA